MIRIATTVTYRDGRAAEPVITQYAVSEYAQWRLAKGLPLPAVNDGRSIGDMHQLRFMAWAELQRDDHRLPGFDAWNRTVDEVAVSNGGAVDPTRPITPDG